MLKHMTNYLITTLIAVVALLPDTASCETKPKSPIVITSKSLIADNKAKTATFEQNVKAVKDDITLLADKMIVYYKEQDNKTSISRIDALGNVSLTRAGRFITADSAIYTVGQNEHIEFVGSAKASDKDNVVTGSKIIYFIKEEKTVVHDSKVILSDKESRLVK